ncbi:hypothetical protein BST63_29040 [Bradyrhizobium canariense]|uniref:Uncharacterized protein n=1 Tax=Bradyrhizobium canariense TaxID=255045 RepID=A0A1X3FJY2_9BRAD|nr:hypothetical protein BST65_39220 [Bradyrhizobium canariense]OSI32250.1 hypothetical protein BST66_16580 [Bradyrhizobium canariense]OSI42705.1 hypothetical protein BST67_39035 [Bradyrhizobium canariense]OSI45093.1 hypothetical protein BSZ20_13095 [Bradyrhizobium canariense]OSI54841.1 hypothetical protein BSZ15_22080 [Bradyrhizobium canariense]
MFSSARRAVDFSTSKMPPQQPDRLLDLFYQPFDFGAHVVLWSRGIFPRLMTTGCSGGGCKAQPPRRRTSVLS